ncbi:hypothetical protein [Sphingobacterium thalpophilum]|uniref:hypothetical protein n=1 Tax=Sphingobacterium thalpophilum TaxID=259 RepID=UPI003D959781
MNKGIFEKRPLRKRSFLQRFFKQDPDENCVIEINNLFTKKAIESVSILDMELIVSRYGISVFKSFGLNMEEFYITYINECCKNGIVSQLELDNIRHLKSLLQISDSTANFYRTKLGTLVIDREYVKFLKNQASDGSEINHFDQLVEFFALPKDVLNGIKHKRNEQYIDSLVRPFVGKKRISINALTELEDALERRNIACSDATKRMLNKYLSYWKLESKDLEQWGTNLQIPRSEICLYEEDNIRWFELRSERGHSRYKLIKVGSLVMTNKRIYLISSDSVSKLDYTQISGIVALSDHVLIQKYKGKEPKLVSQKDQVILEIMMLKIWNAHLSQNWPD